MTHRARRYLLGALSGVAVVGASIGGLHLLQTKDPTAVASIRGSLAVSCTVRSAATSCQQTVPEPAHRDPHPTVYRDGSFDATGHYLTPGGAESIGVRLTVAKGVITAARVEVEAASPTARQFQDQFASRYASHVVAKNLSEVRVSRVAGASLTSVGFSDALAQIKEAAHV